MSLPPSGTIGDRRGPVPTVPAIAGEEATRAHEAACRSILRPAAASRGHRWDRPSESGLA